MAIKIGKHDRVVTAYAERASGPGWGNSPIWVIVRSNLDGSYRQECIQPTDFVPEFVQLYAVSQAAHLAMTEAVRDYLAEISKAKPKRAKPVRTLSQETR